MTSHLLDPTTPNTPAAAERAGRSAGSLLLPVAGGALIAGSLLYVAGMATSPGAVSVEPADYIASLARDPGQTTLSAVLLHYGNMALALAWLAAPALVRGRRGRIGTIAGALLSAVGLVTVTGFVLYDYWTGAIGRVLEAGTAVELFETVAADPGLVPVGLLTMFGLLGPVIAYIGLARAGVTGWWLPLPAVASLVGSMVVPFSPLAHGGFALVGAVPAIVVGLRLIQRNRAEAAVA
ncbi:hypothetical protein [Blastococcus sp. VKM Ac-2987]|uniref:hypothetical protein n=1 Tax=Blastococcus sp. VKM Ac-2987 TaxID=3004141 RepID=UPI0022AB694B|nr:hypothetical protein [Blastococcus sp. VKM Ac-2987]MCZ2858385.1 hypothetical protein [Blastococcus sp. VKM Ac-2987]